LWLIELTFFKCHNFINTLTLAAMLQGQSANAGSSIRVVL
jgi:hypothetical protein